MLRAINRKQGLMTLRYSGLLLALCATNAFALSPGRQLELQPLDRAALAREDAALVLAGAPPRFAVAKRVAVTPANAGTWEDTKDGSRTWRWRVTAPDAVSLNFGFSHFHLPDGATLVVRSADGREARGPFTNADEDAHGQLWTPVVRGNDAVVELKVPAALAGEVSIEIAQVGHGYRAVGGDVAAKLLEPDAPAQCATPGAKDASGNVLDATSANGAKAVAASGACNMDVACLDPTDPWRRVARATAVLTRNGTFWCTGSLVNNTANDRRMLVTTSAACGIDASNVATTVAYWNYENSTCRVPGSAASGAAGDGSLAQFSTGATLVASSSPSDFTMLEMDDPADPAWNLYWAGWDATPYASPGGPGNGDFACSPGAPCATVHQPNTNEKRIAFVEQDLVTTSYNANPIPGDQTHIHAYWDPTPVFPPNPSLSIPPGVTEGGSGGAPLYNAQRRYVGQLHGGPSVCGATGENLSDYFGRFSLSYNVPAARAALDPLGTNALSIDGRAQCDNPPGVPGNVVASTGAANSVVVTWTPPANAAAYDVYRATGACPASGFARIATGVTSPNFNDTTVSGGSTYAYRVVATGAVAGCVSAESTCDDALATGACRLAPTFAGAVSATSAGTPSCAVDVAWNAGAASCGSGLTYSVFRSTTSGFVPGAANRIAQCVSATTYADTTAQPGQRYYYVVRAEDGTSGNGGSCNGGNVDGNTVQRAGTATGTPVAVFTDTMEGTLGAWTLASSPQTVDFAIVTTAAHTGTKSAFAPAPNVLAESTMATTAAFTPAAGATFEFWQRYAMENGFDGGVLEYSLDGTTWFDILAGNGGAIAANPQRFLEGGYVARLSDVTSGNVLAGRDAWTGTQGTFVRTRVDLGDFAGTSMRLRFRVGTDSSFAPPNNGWWIDDVVRYGANACTVPPPDALFANGFE